MDDQIRAMLQYAVGQPRPLRFSVQPADEDGPGLGEAQTIEVNSPFAVLGRGQGVDLFLDGETVAFRHAYLQVIGNRIACIDLFSLNGIHWEGLPATPWLSADRPFRIGGHRLKLEEDWAADDLVSPLDFKPRDEQRIEYGTLPTVNLQLLNSSAKGVVWPINRVITLVGRDERCRIKISDDRISKVHCSLLLLPTGLWVVDLLGKGGIKLNGYECRCGYVAQGCELQLGGYVMTALYPDAAVAAPAPAPDSITSSNSGAFATRINKVFKVETYDETVVVIPMGDVSDFSYKEIHLDAGRITELFTKHGFRNLIIDFSVRPFVGSVIIDALVSFCRTARGRSMFCNVSTEMQSSLDEMRITTKWPIANSREEALSNVTVP